MDVCHFFIVAIQIHILLRLLALCLSLEHLDDDLLLLNQESTLDPENKCKRPFRYNALAIENPQLIIPMLDDNF